MFLIIIGSFIFDTGKIILIKCLFVGSFIVYVFGNLSILKLLPVADKVYLLYFICWYIQFIGGLCNGRFYCKHALWSPKPPKCGVRWQVSFTTMHSNKGIGNIITVGTMKQRALHNCRRKI